MSIARAKRPAASVKSRARRRVEAPAAKLLRDDGLLAIPYLRYSSQAGVLVFAGTRRSRRRAHARGATVPGAEPPANKLGAVALRLITAGESHGPGLTCIVEGLPAGLEL